MSIQAKGITKRYGTQLAVDHVSFTIESGEIAGFIGPNGAGKSTTMKILTGTLPPDQGEVFIKGISVLERQRDIRKILGYLPEHNPLYLEMYVREYLGYVSGLYAMEGSKVQERVSVVIEMTGLEPESHKKIGALSKGYRQRVGLAQALIHDPEILILDEPTTGLDPNQLVEIRSLISEISRDKTILLSTHILQEVEAICDRVLIINEGKIAADEDAGILKEKGKQRIQTIQIELASEPEVQIWQNLPFVENVRVLNKNQFLLETHTSRDIRGDIFNFAVDQGLTILSLTLKQKSLEEVFREITGY